VVCQHVVAAEIDTGLKACSDREIVVAREVLKILRQGVVELKGGQFRTLRQPKPEHLAARTEMISLSFADRRHLRRGQTGIPTLAGFASQFGGLPAAGGRVFDDAVGEAVECVTGAEHGLIDQPDLGLRELCGCGPEGAARQCVAYAGQIIDAGAPAMMPSKSSG
jgi:hypothetical protein